MLRAAAQSTAALTHRKVDCRSAQPPATEFEKEPGSQPELSAREPRLPANRAPCAAVGPEHECLSAREGSREREAFVVLHPSLSPEKQQSASRFRIFGFRLALRKPGWGYSCSCSSISPPDGWHWADLVMRGDKPPLHGPFQISHPSIIGLRGC